MTFFERYAKAVEKCGLKPGSEKAASLFGSNKSTVSKWKTANTTPYGNIVAAVADAFHVSTDYLLGRTDDPTDYANEPFPEPVPEPIQMNVPEPPIDERTGRLIRLIDRLDPEDRLRAEGMIQGMLLQDKYLKGETLPNAAHARTDIAVTEEMVSHDEGIMDAEDF